jgi:hypothetical protein
VQLGSDTEVPTIFAAFRYLVRYVPIALLKIESLWSTFFGGNGKEVSMILGRFPRRKKSLAVQ